MADKTELKKANGDVFLIAERMPDNSYVLAQWIGLQNIETVMQGGNYYIELLQKQPCPKLLNSHAELIGPWNVANDWIVQAWTPRVRALGLRYMAQVLAPGVYGQMSFHQLHQRISNVWEIKMFDDEPSAQDWLLSVP
ncbi:hypothetical protein [Adhaeribacter pallidiroseus]|uniref:STAS/SEC14 domain-containing protein n=1 Tax=Adhaeribacter pallidiroseus TaxID=2072847 RepID=A0A369QJD6_9BACT|nr:hypothetical protein [Adhaeribacter pallidiroseus]RDC65021.1 hypothetical protein AHMF7616_03644 [Adhaeribacter pallidiroseus]